MATGRKVPESIRRKRSRRAAENKTNEIKNSEHVRKKVNKRRKNKEKDFTIAKKAFAITMAIVVLIVVGSALFFINFFDKIESNVALAGVAPGRGEPVNILVLGMDIGDPNQVENTNIKRTDSMMLLNYNPKSKEAKIVSIPRDTLVRGKTQNYKINASYQIGGESKVKQDVENLVSVNINYIAKIDYEGFRQFIDAIGGVNIDIERDMIYDDDAQNLHINLKKGENQHLDGAKAEQFFRWRKNNDGSGFANGDLDRIENQHKFLEKVVKKCTSPSIVFKIPKILNVISNNIQTNMQGNKIMSYGLNLMELKKDAIEMTTLQGTPKMIQGQSYLVVDKSANAELISSLHSSSKKETTINKENTKILVQNATKINGLAAEVKGQLSSLGWSKVDTGNATNGADKSVIATNDEALKDAISKELPKIKSNEKIPNSAEYSSYDVVIILGNDYKN